MSKPILEPIKPLNARCIVYCDYPSGDQKFEGVTGLMVGQAGELIIGQGKKTTFMARGVWDRVEMEEE